MSILKTCFPDLYIREQMVDFDYYSKYIPILSTVLNLVHLFQKAFQIPSLTETELSKNRYFRHINQKSVFRCLVLLIPFIGNIAVVIHDYHQKKEAGRLYCLAENYWNGKGDQKDTIEACKFYRRASVLGHAKATSKLAENYTIGDGVPRDFNESKRLADIGLDRGDASSIEAIQLSLKDDEEKRVTKLVQAAYLGNLTAYHYLGVEFQYGGTNISKNVAVATSFFKYAVENGYVGSNENLKMLQ